MKIASDCSRSFMYTSSLEMAVSVVESIFKAFSLMEKGRKRWLIINQKRFPADIYFGNILFY